MAFPRCGCIRHHLGCITVSYGRDVVVNVRETEWRKEQTLWSNRIVDGMDNVRYHWLHRYWLVRQPQHMAAEDPRVSALYLYLCRAAKRTAA